MCPGSYFFKEPQTGRIVQCHVFYAESLPFGGVVVTWLVRSSLDRTVQIQALAGYIVLCLVFSGKTLYSHSASLHEGVYM